MKKVKILLLSILLVYFVQETSPLLSGGFESLVEYATENSEAKEEYVVNHLSKAERKKGDLIKDHQYSFAPISKFRAITQINLTIKRPILYRTLLI